MSEAAVTDSCRQGVASIEAGDFDDALDAFSKALEADPGFVEAYCYRGIAKHGKGDMLGAIADFEKAIDILAGSGESDGGDGALGAGASCVEEMFAKIFADVPEQEWQKLPSDLSYRHDFYMNEDVSK